MKYAEVLKEAWGLWGSMGSECWGRWKEGVRCGECGGRWGKVWRKMWGSVGESGRWVWESVKRRVRWVGVVFGECGNKCRVSVEDVGKGVTECVGTPTFPHLYACQHTFPHFNTTSTLTHTLFHTSPTYPTPPLLPNTLPIPPPQFSTPSFYVSLILDPTPQTTKTFPIIPSPITFPNSLYSPILSQFFPILLHTCFIIIPTPRFLTFLIYCQI